MAKRTAAAAPREDATERAPTAAEFAEMRRQLVALTQNYNELKAATGGVELLPPEEVPVYEIGEGSYFSADCVHYPPGVQIEDVTGTIIPNEQMIPLNAAAERRMASYLSQLPQAGNTPTAEMWIEATAAVLPTFDGSGMSPVERDAELHRLVLEQIARIRAKQMGLRDEAPRLPVRPQRTGPVPLMSNTRIRQGDLDPRLSHVPGPAPTRGEMRTRLRQAAVAPAQKAAPPMGTVQNQTLGR